MVVSHAHFCDTEGFFDVFRQRAKIGSKDHQTYFTKDIIRNEFSLQEQEIKKEKWRVYSKVLKFINYFDNKYKPLDDAKIEADKLNKLMTTFPKIMEVMNENKLFFINYFLFRA